MRVGLQIAAWSLLGWPVVAGVDIARADNPPTNKTESNRSFDLKDLPLPVIETAQKEVPKIAFLNVEKQSSWRRGQYYRIWAMDEKQRQIYLEISASGKVIERPKVIKQKETQTKEQQTQTQTKEQQTQTQTK